MQKKQNICSNGTDVERVLNMKKRLFIDMDGTLAVFRPVDTLEILYEKNYFLDLEPHINVVEAIKDIINKDVVEIFILSSVLSDSKFALKEKNEWLDEYLPKIDKDHRIFPPCGADKKDYIPDGIKSNDFLLDDYTYNLTLWSPPAKGIKLLNGINDTRGTWQDSKLSYSKTSSELADDILSIVLNDKVIRHDLMKFIDVEKEVIDYVRYKLEENYIYNVEILGAKVYGSRGGGANNKNSDLDVLIEFKGNIREDDMFNLINCDDFKINGIKVDINPITKDKSGTIEEYLNKNKPKKSLYDFKSSINSFKNESQAKTNKDKENIYR